MSIANSVEGRVPSLCVHQLKQFACLLPREYKLGLFGWTNRILVDAFSHLLPDYVVTRRTACFGMPVRSIFAARQAVCDLPSLHFLGELARFNRTHILGLIDRQADYRAGKYFLIYALKSFQEWYGTNSS